MQTLLLVLTVAIGIGGFFGYFSRVVGVWLLGFYRRLFFKPQLLKLIQPPTVKTTKHSTAESSGESLESVVKPSQNRRG